MSSSSKDRGHPGRDDCQIHVDKEGESCVIKIESVGQEKMLKEVLERMNILKTDLNQLINGSNKQQSSKEILDAVHELTTKFKAFEDQLQKMNKSLTDDHQQAHRSNTDLNKKLDDIKHDFNDLKQQQKNNGLPKENLEKIQQKLDNLDKQLKSTMDEGQKRLSSDLQNLHQQVPSKNDLKPILDAIHNLQNTFDKEKSKPDILARKIDSIDQKLKDSQPEHTALMKDIQTKIDPLHKSSPQTSETLMKINDRIKAMQTDSTKPHPEILKKLDDLDQQLKNQHQHVVEPIKQVLNEKLNPLVEQQKSGLIAKKDAEDRLGSPNQIDRDDESSASPKRVPLCVNGMIPVLSKLSDPHVLAALAADISKKLNDLSKQGDLLKNIDSKLNHVAQHVDKDHDPKHRVDTQANLSKEIATRTEPLQQSVENLSKQQQPLLEAIRDLPKKMDQMLQAQPQNAMMKDLSSKIDPLTQTMKNINDHVNQDHQALANIEKKLDRAISDTQKAPDVKKEIDQALQPFSYIVQLMKENLEKAREREQEEFRQQQAFRERLGFPAQEEAKRTDVFEPILNRLDEFTTKSRQSTEPLMKKISDDVEQIKTLVNTKDPTDEAKKLDRMHEQLRQIAEKINDPTRQPASNDFNQSMKKIDPQVFNDIPKQLDSIKETLDKMKKTDPSNEPVRAVKDIHDRIKQLDDTMKELPEKISSKFKRSSSDEDRMNPTNLRQVPLSQSSAPESTHPSITHPDYEKANLLTNLLTLQTSFENAEKVPSNDVQPYLKRLEQSPLVRNDRDLNGLVQHLMNMTMNNNRSKTPPSSSLNNDSNRNPMNTASSTRSNPSSSLQQSSPAADMNPSESFRDRSRNSAPNGYLTKSRYIPIVNEEMIRQHWPKLASRSSPVIETILNQPYQFDSGTNLDRLIKQQNLDQYASMTRNAIEKPSKDYDKICYMMDSVVFDQMTMIGSREALIRPLDPSLLNRASSKGSYAYPSGNGRNVDRYPVHRNIALWMVETDDNKPYHPTEFLPNISRLNEKYDKIQQPQYNEIRQKRRDDETRWNERYAFTKDNRTVLFVNDLRSYFMDYDTKRKYQVHDGVPINPVCRTGIAGRGDLPFWGPNHCVVVILLRNATDPEVVLMRHHGDAWVLPKGFYGHEARYDNQIKIIQDPVSGQILPHHLLDYWWSQVSKYNESNSTTSHLKRVLNEKELKEEFAEIFSQKGCNKSVFDNGYVDHPLNTDHAWIESSVWKIQFKDWRIPEMKSSKYAIANDDWKNSQSAINFFWVKLTDAVLIVPPFDRGLLVDVLATGMPI